MIPEHIQKKLAATRRIDLTPQLKRERACIALIDTALSTEEFEAVPYDIILDGATAHAAFIKAVRESRALAQQVIGIFCYSLKEASAIRACWADLRLGDICQIGIADVATATADNLADLQDLPAFPSSAKFADTVASADNVSIWRPGDLRPRLHLLLQLWKPGDPSRWQELKAALIQNAINPLVHRIHILLDGANAAEAYADWPAWMREKLTVFPSQERLNFKWAFEYMAILPKGDYAALINTDIYFDRSIRELWNVSMKNRCISLLRYEVTLAYARGDAGAAEPRLFGPRADSQDSWIFAVDELVDHQARGESWRELDFCMGKPGCDNAIMGELLRRKWSLANPAYSIRALHIHANPARGYSVNELVSLGLYVHLWPVALS
jgi:hypothetical protein